MKDVDKLALALVASAALVSGAVIWVGVTLRDAIDASTRAVGSARAAPPRMRWPARRPVATAELAPEPSPAEPEAPRLRQEDFDAVWRQGLMTTGEKACWGPIDESGELQNPTPHFNITVGPDGRVAEAAYSPGAEERFGKLFPCLAKIVETMTFPATGETLSGEIQVNRPAAFEPPPKAAPEPER